MTLGVFGGTFNPVHYGHLRAAEEVRQKLGLDRVLFVPTGIPPLKSEHLAPADLRLRMVRMAVASNERFEVSEVEINRPDKSYSVETAEQLKNEFPGSRLVFMLGIDAFMDLPLWREPERLLGLADFAVMSRPGHAFAELASSDFVYAEAGVLEALDEGRTETASVKLRGGASCDLVSVTPLGVSASAIRFLARRRMSFKYLLPEDVESFIMSNGLYSAD